MKLQIKDKMLRTKQNRENGSMTIEKKEKMAAQVIA